MSVKAFGIAVKLTLGGKNQFTHPSTYVFIILTGSLHFDADELFQQGSKPISHVYVSHFELQSML